MKIPKGMRKDLSAKDNLTCESVYMHNWRLMIEEWLEELERRLDEEKS